MKRMTTAALTLIGGASLTVSCAAPPGTVSTDERTVATAGEPATSGVCGMLDTPAGPEPIFYVFSAMNHKLEHYPELARAVGLDSVSDCESAERYVDGYAAFSAEHPDFDDDESFDDVLIEDPAPPPSGSSARLEVQKILGGSAAFNNPVVFISFDATNQGGHVIPESAVFGLRSSKCSGTYIAKNWILTAAHCMTKSAVYHCIKDGINPVLSTGFMNPACVPRLPTYSQWTIRSKLPDSSILTMSDVWAIAYVNPAWVGNIDPSKDPAINPKLKEGGGVQQNVSGFSDNDIALLYVPDDSILPPRVEEDGAKRLSIVPLPEFAEWTFQAFGWGSGNTLRTTGADGIALSLFSARRIVGESSMSQGSPCDGDSGGPLMRMNTPIQTNVGTTAQSVQVIVGVSSTGSHPAACDADVVPTGIRRSSWANVAHKSNFDFIEKMIRRWNGNPITEQSGFKCRRRRVENDGTANQVAECWGFPCTRDLDCDSNFSGKICSRPGRNYTSCPTCDTSTEPQCGCMVGQCLLDPREASPP